METKTFEKKIADLKNELIAWLNDECPSVAPPLEPYDNSDLSHNFCEHLRIRLDELSVLRAEQGEKKEDREFNPATDLMIKPGQCKYCGK